MKVKGGLLEDTTEPALSGSVKSHLGLLVFQTQEIN